MPEASAQISHGGSRLGLDPRWVHAATVARGIGGHQRSPTVQRNRRSLALQLTQPG
jgi:hypothetical protein